jgi:hypothetical protein
MATRGQGRRSRERPFVDGPSLFEDTNSTAVESHLPSRLRGRVWANFQMARCGSRVHRSDSDTRERVCLAQMILNKTPFIAVRNAQALPQDSFAH